MINFVYKVNIKLCYREKLPYIILHQISVFLTRMSTEETSEQSISEVGVYEWCVSIQAGGGSSLSVWGWATNTAAVSTLVATPAAPPPLTRYATVLAYPLTPGHISAYYSIKERRWLLKYHLLYAEEGVWIGVYIDPRSCVICDLRLS